MVDLVVDGDELVVRLHGAERAEAVHGDVRLPRSAIRAVEVVDDPARAVGGWKLIGSRWPGAFAMGTFDDGGRRCFAVVHHGVARGVRVVLDGAAYEEVVVSSDDPDAVVAAIAPPPAHSQPR